MKDTQPSPYDYGPGPRRSNWNVTFGVLGIVFGIFGLTGSVWGIASAMLTPAMFKIMPSTPPAPAPGSGGAAPATPPPPPAIDPAEVFKGMSDSMGRWVPLSIVMHSILLLLAILLLVGGILLLNRRPAGARLLTGWAYGKIVAGIGASYAGYLMQSAQMRAMVEGFNRVAVSSGGPGGPAPGFAGGMGETFSIVAGVSFFLGAIWYCVLPVVFLIWLHRDVVKADIAAWVAPKTPVDAESAS